MKKTIRNVFLAATLSSAAVLGMNGCMTDHERKMNDMLEQARGDYQTCREKDIELRMTALLKGKESTGLKPGSKCHRAYYGDAAKDLQRATGDISSSPLPGF